MIPKEAMMVTVLYDADLVPTAADMKLVASLLTPAIIPKIANTKIKTITIGRNVYIVFLLKIWYKYTDFFKSLTSVKKEKIHALRITKSLVLSD